MIAGIDLSTRAIDVVLLGEDTDAATWHRFELEGQDAWERARAVRASMPGASFWDDVVAVGIEDPRGYGSGSLYRVQGAILSCIPNSKLVHPLIPSSWRKTVGLKGNVPKSEVGGFVRRMFPFGHPSMTWPQDACDAYCIALATRNLIELGEAA